MGLLYQKPSLLRLQKVNSGLSLLCLNSTPFHQKTIKMKIGYARVSTQEQNLDLQFVKDTFFISGGFRMCPAFLP